MTAKFFPDEIVPSAYVIDYDRLYAEGIRGVLYDVDNTLVPHGAPPDDRAMALFAHLQALGMKTALVSNNREGRVRRFADRVGTQYVCRAGKPSRRGYLSAMKLIGTDRTNTLFVGDQLYTDIWGARRSGLRAVLTRPVHPAEELQIALKRLLEKPVLRRYERFRRRHPIPPEQSVLLREMDGRLPEPYGRYDGASGSLRNEKK